MYFSESRQLVILARATSRVHFGFFEHGDSNSDNSSGARAAFSFGFTGGVFTNEFTFRFGAFRFVAFPVTSGFFTDSFTFGFGSLAMSNTVRLFTDGHTFRAVFSFTGLVGTFNFTIGFFTFNITDSVSRFLARGVAFGGFTDGVTNGRAFGIVTFPSTFGMAFLLQLDLSGHG